MSFFVPIGEQLQNRFINYIHRRRGPLTLPLELKYRQIFILPGKFGSGFAILLALMTLAALNYNNNLALILAYLLQAIFLYSSNLAYKNLRGIKISSAVCEPVFCGQTAQFKIRLEAPDCRHSLELVCGSYSVYTNVSKNKSSTVSIDLATTRRGVLRLKPWKIQSVWPFGFFRSWSWLVPQETCFVYPRPASDPPPLPTARNFEGQALSQLNDDPLYGLREYHPGDPINKIAWRISAKTETLICREDERQKSGDIHLNWDALSGLDTEKRLSILCAWILLAEENKLSWSFRLPGHELEKGRGRDHQKLALMYLALYEISPPASDGEMK